MSDGHLTPMEAPVEADQSVAMGCESVHAEMTQNSAADGHADAKGSGRGHWPAKLQLDFHPGPRRTFVHRSHAGPLTMQRPFYPEGKTCHVTVLHPPGGVVSGDRLLTQVSVRPEARAVMVTPGATKHYRSRDAVGHTALSSTTTGHVLQDMTINQGALEWLPNESIHFNGSNTHIDTRFHLVGDARLIALDVQVFGRTAGQQPFVTGQADVSLSVFRGNTPLLLDRLRVQGQSFATSAAGLRGHTVYGTLIATHASDDLVERVRNQITSCPLPGTQENHTDLFAVTRIDELLLVRYLGHSSENALHLLRFTRSIIRSSVIGQAQYSPRVWTT
jgi:urease accessory protein